MGTEDNRLVTSHRAGIVIGAVMLCLLAHQAFAQVVVWDPLHVAKIEATAEFAERINDRTQEIDHRVRRFARPFSLFESLARYLSPDPWPRWRTRRVDPALPIAEAFMVALNTGGSATALIDRVLVDRVPVDPDMAIGSDLGFALATLDLADSALARAVNQTGTIRGRRREEVGAMTAQVEHLLSNGSTGRILDKLTGAAAIRVQQQATRQALLSSVLDLLLVRTKRSRDAGAQQLLLNPVLVEKPPNDAAGTREALAWRQP